MASSEFIFIYIFMSTLAVMKLICFVLKFENRDEKQSNGEKKRSTMSKIPTGHNYQSHTKDRMSSMDNQASNGINDYTSSMPRLIYEATADNRRYLTVAPATEQQLRTTASSAAAGTLAHSPVSSSDKLNNSMYSVQGAISNTEDEIKYGLGDNKYITPLNKSSQNSSATSKISTFMPPNPKFSYDVPFYRTNFRNNIPSDGRALNLPTEGPPCHQRQPEYQWTVTSQPGSIMGIVPELDQTPHPVSHRQSTDKQHPGNKSYGRLDGHTWVTDRSTLTRADTVNRSCIRSPSVLNPPTVATAVQLNNNSSEIATSMAALANDDKRNENIRVNQWKDGTSLTGQRDQWKDGTSVNGQRDQWKDGTSVTGQRGQWKDGTSVTGQKDQWMDGTSVTGQRDQWKDGTSVTGQRDQWKDGTSVTGQRYQWKNGTSVTGQRDQWKDRTSVTDQRETANGRIGMPKNATTCNPHVVSKSYERKGGINDSRLKYYNFKQGRNNSSKDGSNTLTRCIQRNIKTQPDDKKSEQQTLNNSNKAGGSNTVSCTGQVISNSTDNVPSVPNFHSHPKRSILKKNRSFAELATSSDNDPSSWIHSGKSIRPVHVAQFKPHDSKCIDSSIFATSMNDFKRTNSAVKDYGCSVHSNANTRVIESAFTPSQLGVAKRVTFNLAD